MLDKYKYEIKVANFKTRSCVYIQGYVESPTYVQAVSDAIDNMNTLARQKGITTGEIKSIFIQRCYEWM